MSKVITVDFDGCITYPLETKIKYSQIFHGIEISAFEATNETYPLGSENYLELMRKINTEMASEIQIDSECEEVLQWYNERGYDIYVVSSRIGESLEAAREFVEKYKLPIKDCFGTGNDGVNYLPKREVCKRLNSLAMIDDTYYKLKELEDTEMKLFFLQRPWNQHEATENERIKLIQSWKEFILD